MSALEDLTQQICSHQDTGKALLFFLEELKAKGLVFHGIA